MDFIQPMMELLKLLGTLGAYSLAVAISAIVGILVFKLTQLVSIILLIKYGITRLFDWMVHKKTVIIDKTTNFNLEKRFIRSEDEDNAKLFLDLLERLSNIKYPNGYKYIHSHDIKLLEEAVEYLEKKYSKKQKDE